MYICVCKAVTESDIKKAVREGANCMHHLESKLGVNTQCGSCSCDAANCLEKIIGQEMGSVALVGF